VRLALLGPDGAALPLRLVGETTAGAAERVIELAGTVTTATFAGIVARPVPSLLRGFSAPVRLESVQSDDELLFLLRHDADLCNRWEAMQRIQSRAVTALIEAGAAGPDAAMPPALIAAYRSVLDAEEADSAWRALALRLPTFAGIADGRQSIAVEAIDDALRAIRNALAGAARTGKLSTRSTTTRRRTHSARPQWTARAGQPRARFPDQRHRRARAGVAAISRCRQHDRCLGALVALNDADCAERQVALAEFRDRWQDTALLLDRALALEATGTCRAAWRRSPRLSDPAFDRRNPNGCARCCTGSRNGTGRTSMPRTEGVRVRATRCWRSTPAIRNWPRGWRSRRQLAPLDASRQALMRRNSIASRRPGPVGRRGRTGREGAGRLSGSSPLPPVGLDGDLAGFLALVLLQAASFQHERGVGHHVGVAAKHALRGRRIEPEPGARLEPAIADRIGNAPLDRVRGVFARDEGNVLELVRVRRLDALYDFLVRQLALEPAGMDEHDVPETRPGFRRAQEAHERAQRGARGKPPQRFAGWHFAQAEEAVGARGQVHRVARFEPRQPRRQRAGVDAHGVELVRRLPGGTVDEGIRPADHLVVDRQRQASELARVNFTSGASTCSENKSSVQSRRATTRPDPLAVIDRHCGSCIMAFFRCRIMTGMARLPPGRGPHPRRRPAAAGRARDAADDGAGGRRGVRRRGQGQRPPASSGVHPPATPPSSRAGCRASATTASGLRCRCGARMARSWACST
jgi:hypothetical protein